MRDVAREAHRAAFRDDARDTLYPVVGNEAALPVAPLRPRIGIEQIDTREGCIGQPVEQFACVAEMQANICQRILFNCDQRFGDRVDKSICADETDA